MMISEYFTPKLFSLLQKGYDFATFKADLIAGLTVAIVALPLSMALGIASGASPDKGLITTIVAGFFISLLGGSRVQIGGPTGAFIVVVFNVIAQYGYDGLILATIMAGIILIIAGYSGFGRVIKYIPYPVITGFTAGIAVIIASSQIKDLLGLDIIDLPAEFLDKWSMYWYNLDSFNVDSLAIGGTALVSILLLKRYAPKLPGYLIALLLTSVAVFFLHLPVETIGSRFPDIVSGLPLPQLPQFNLNQLLELVPAAFTIAFLAGIESLLSAVVADGMTGYKHRSNQELVGQGVANLASAMFGGMPSTGAIARTATNIKSGGKTPVAGIIHALFILLFILFATDVMSFIPLAALAAILLIVSWNMCEISHFIRIIRLSRSDCVVMLMTFFLTILVDLTVSIGVGVTLASLLFMKEMSQSLTLRSQGRRIRDGQVSGEDDGQRDELPEGVEVFRVMGPIFFGVAGTMLETLQTIGKVPEVLIVRMRLVPYMDVAGVDALAGLIKECHKQHTRVVLTGLQHQPAMMLRKAGFVEDKKSLWMLQHYDDAIALSRQLVS